MEFGGTDMGIIIVVYFPINNKGNENHVVRQPLSVHISSLLEYMDWFTSFMAFDPIKDQKDHLSPSNLCLTGSVYVLVGSQWIEQCVLRPGMYFNFYIFAILLQIRQNSYSSLNQYMVKGLQWNFWQGTTALLDLTIYNRPSLYQFHTLN